MSNSLPAFFSLQKPYRLKYPFLVSSPHSGTFYPNDFLSLTRLPLAELRKSEDSHVDSLFDQASLLGGMFLKARMARIFCDLNRKAWELDPDLFRETLPHWCHTDSHHVKHGMGTLHKISTKRKLIYKHYLSFEKISQHIQNYWFPYHAQIQHFITQSCQEFGGCIILDVHSMPSARKRTAHYADIVLGDAFSQSCSPWLIHSSLNFFRQKNLIVNKNIPYAGGYITRHYGNPKQNIHVMQIEVNKSLYMNELSLTLNSGHQPIKALLTDYMQWLFPQWQNILT